MDESNIKWHFIYEKIATALYNFYNDCVSRNMEPGKELYLQFRQNAEFSGYHSWLNKFDKEFGVPSVDPFHVFASISSNTSPYKNRTIRTKALLKVLNVYTDFTEIDFDGCPAPRMIRILSVRSVENQKQIWEFFQRIYKTDRIGLYITDFENYKKWYGIEISSFTIFLFWIKSDYFLPIEKNTRTFLVSTKIILSFPNDYDTYISLLHLIDKFNEGYNNKIYFNKGLFREITQVSYNVISKGIQTNSYSTNLDELIKNVTSVPEKIEGQIDISIGEKIVEENILSSTEIIDEINTISGLGFKIIAIKPLQKCQQDYLNILTKDKVYHFEKTITIDGETIKYIKENNFPFYDISPNGNSELKINVTAIVGKNGSGKSSLIELFFRIINNITFKFKNELNTSDIELVPELEAELYYVSSGQLHCIYINDAEIAVQDYSFNGATFDKYNSQRTFTIDDFDNWFYTIAVNYSHYALNSNSIDNWIDELFHKNDSYQAPLVINPMRTAGNLNINIEIDLVRYRLLANLFMPMEDEMDFGIRQITEKQKAIKIDFEFIPDKNKILYKKYPEGKEISILFSELKTPREVILKKVSEIFELSLYLNDLQPEIEIGEKVIEESENYIIRKLVKIAVTYSLYKQYFDEDEIKLREEYLEDYLRKLKKDKSHITFKLKQAVNYLKYPYLYEKTRNFSLNTVEDSIRLDNFIAKDEKLKDIDIIELLPPAIFKPIIWLQDKEGTPSDFERLSSGEKQFIHTVSSILYHIKNIDSVGYSSEKLIVYHNINLLMDEIELYYHPELQREYLSNLLKMFSRLSLSNIDAINICFVTHSPFILSDIPNSNILFLGEDGLPDQKAELVKTFGANIHDLLKHSFFLTKGTIGEVAKSKILDLTKYLNNKNDTTDGYWDKDKAEQFISKIGEPIIKDRLSSLFDKKFFTGDNVAILQRIESLKAELLK